MMGIIDQTARILHFSPATRRDIQCFDARIFDLCTEVNLLLLLVT